MNEISDLQIVVDGVETAARSGRNLNIDAQEQLAFTSLATLIKRADDTLSDIYRLVYDDILGSSGPSDEARVNRLRWMRQRQRASKPCKIC
jgi:hypothetical protein